MLWICLVGGGAVLGYLLSYDEWTGFLIGALMGWAVWAGIRVRVLGKRSEAQLQQILATGKNIETLQQRLGALERQPAPAFVPPAQDAAPLPVDAVILQAPTAGPELIWDLPDEPQTQPTQPPEPAAALPQPSPPATPNLLDRAIERAKNWLLGGNTVLRVGVVVLFLGLAFLLRYATEGVVVPVEARYAGVAASALALLALGWWLRLRNGPYALMLQGAGGGVLYLTVFAAMKLHALLDPTLGFALLVAVTVFSAILALNQNSLALACAGAGLRGRTRRVCGTDSGLDRSRQPRFAVQLFRPAQCGHHRHRLVQGLARPQPDRLFRHLRHRLRLGHQGLHPRTVLEHRTLPDSVLPDVSGYRSAVRPPQAAGTH